MKSFLLSAAVAILLNTSSALAQLRPSLGIKAGLSIPNLTSGSTSNPISSGYGSRLDADAAIHIEFPFCAHFSLQPQLEYSSQGGKKNGTQSFSVPDELLPLFPAGEVPPYLYADYKSEAKINYLILPVLAKYRFYLKGHWSAYAAAGPFISYLLNAKNITKGSSRIYLDPGKTQPVTAEPQSFDHREKITGDLHRFNTGISGHLGIGYKLKKGSIFLEAGGNYGLIDIQKGNVNGKNKTGAATIDLGYQFRL